MNKFLQKLINKDIKICEFSTDSQIIQQGLAPLLALNNTSITLQKAKLLEQVKFRNWQKQAHRLFNRLSDSDIKFIVFKGFSYTHLLYENTHLRPYSDIDILIEKSNYKKCFSLLNHLGYRCFPSRQGKFVSFQNSFYNVESPQTVIDLHWQINNRIEFHQYFPFDFLYKDATTIKFDESSFLSPSIIKSFIIGCFHYQAHSPKDRKHIWLYDLALMWNIMNQDQQNICINLTIKSKQTNLVFTTLKQLNMIFKDCLDIDSTLVISLHESTQKYSQMRRRKISDINTRLKNISGFANKIKFLSEYIFQSKEYVQSRYALNNSKFIYLYYPRMWIEDIFKLFK